MSLTIGMSMITTPTVISSVMHITDVVGKCDKRL